MLVLLALATHVTTARADSGANTITATSITAPSDPAYLYDATGGAYGGFTVSGTTNSTDPASDAVDIDCYYDDGNSSGGDEYTVASDVALNADGGFSTTVPYSALEDGYAIYDPNASMCRLRAVPAGSGPSSGLSSFAGPRVLLAYLVAEYDYNTRENLDDYELAAPQLGVTDVYSAAPSCGLMGAYLNDQSIFGQADGESFACSDVDGTGVLPQDQLQVDGSDAYMPYSTNYEADDPADQLTVSVVHDAANGDIAVTETDPVYVCSDGACDSYVSSGVEQDRTIRQTAGGHVVEITDSFRSTDGNAHSVNLALSSQMCFQTAICGYGGYNGAVSYEFPGESGFSTHVNNDTEAVGSQSPASIYVAGGNLNGAITYFTPPSQPFSFYVQQYSSYGYTDTYDNALIAPYELSVFADRPAQLTYAYSTDVSQAALPADIATATALQPTAAITITSPAAGATTSASTVTVTGNVIAATAVDSVTVNGVSATLDGSSYSATVPLSAGSNTLTAVVTLAGGDTASTSETVTYSPAPSSSDSFTPPITISPAQAGHWAGPTWLPIADTGRARHAGRHRERLSGRVTSGSGAVTYYFQYGARGHLTHHTRMVTLAASQASQPVAVTVGGLSRGTKYSYRLVATGTYGNATGRKRSFNTTARKK